MAGTSGSRGPLGETGAPRPPSDGTGSAGTPSDRPAEDAPPPNDDAGGGVSDGAGGRFGTGGARSARGVDSIGRDVSGASTGPPNTDGGADADADAPPLGERRWKSWVNSP